MSWRTYSEKIIADPYNVINYEKLVLVAEKLEDPQLIHRSYKLLLTRYPLFCNYWIRYLQWQTKNGTEGDVKLQYERLLAGDLKYSCELWIAYLKHRIQSVTSDNLTELIAVFERARGLIGFDYWRSEEFYLLYLQTIWTYRPRRYLLLYYTLVRIVLEIPMHNFKVFHQIWLQFLATLKLNQMKYLKMLTDTGKPGKSAGGATGGDVATATKIRWKKSLTDLYITTQYKSYELFQWEKHLVRKDDSNVELWRNYLLFVITHYPSGYTERLFERALLDHPDQSTLWWMYASYLLNQQKPLAARQNLYRSIRHLMQPEATIARLVDMELYAKNYLRARDLLLAYMDTSSNAAYSVVLFDKLVMVEQVLHANDGDYILELFTGFLDSINGEGASSKKEQTTAYILYRLSLVQTVDINKRKDAIERYKASGFLYEVAIKYINSQMHQQKKDNHKNEFTDLIETYI